MRVVNSFEMNEIERMTFEEFGLSENQIIENVGLRAADFIDQNLIVDQVFGELVVLVGKGNNGADGLSIARHLANKGFSIRAFVLFPDSKDNEEFNTQLLLAQKFGVKISEVTSIDDLGAYFTQTQDSYFVIDSVFGMGLRLPISNYLFDVINLVNEYGTTIVSIDLPSGITGDKGEMSSNAIMADYTLAIGLPKTGLYIGDGARHSGEIFTLEVGFPKNLLEGGDKAILTAEGIYNTNRSRNKFGHKNVFGHCLVIAGSKGITGAAVMASEAALKAGTGLVTSVTWPESYDELTSKIIPEIMTGVVPQTDDEVQESVRFLERYDSILIGPGLGRSEKTRELLLNVLAHFYGPVVIDADAIMVFNREVDSQTLQARKGPTIFTPHVGEFASAMGVSTSEVVKNPIELVKKFVDDTKSCVVLKGACTFLAFPTGEVFLNYYPNDGMASGGSGDVLAGIIAGMCAQNAPDQMKSGIFADSSRLYQGICEAVAVHTLAGKAASEDLGPRAMTARSIIGYFPDAFGQLSKGSF